MKSIFFVFSLVLSIISSLQSFAVAPVEKPKVIVAEMKLVSNIKKIMIPVKVEAKIQSLVSAEIEGHVTKILKPLGSFVRAGEAILVLENKDPGFTFAAVPVRAPVAGVVSQIYISQMAKVVRGEKLFTVINPKSLKLSAELPSNDLQLVKAGVKGSFKVSNQDESEFGVKLVGISPLVDPRTGTASAELEFINTKSALPPIGSLGNVVIEVTQGQSMLVPESSLFYQDGKPMVRVLKADNKFDKKSIELGEQRDNQFVVKSGVIQGEKVVVRSSRPLKEGETLDIEGASEKAQ